MKIITLNGLKMNVLNGKVISARDIKTGRFVKLVQAQITYDVFMTDTTKEVDLYTQSGLAACVAFMLGYLSIITHGMSVNLKSDLIGTISDCLITGLVITVILSIGMALVSVLSNMFNIRYTTKRTNQAC